MEPILGPGGRYRLRLELLQEAGNATYLRRQATAAQRQGDECILLFGEDATAKLLLGEGGITLQSLALAKGGQAVLQAEVEAGPSAPSWLPTASTVSLFEGDRQAAAALRDRFVPLPGAVEQSSAGIVSLDQLFLAVGRSMARANGALVQIASPGGTALVTTVTVSIAIDGLAVDRGRVLVQPTSPSGVGQGGAAQPGAGQAGAAQAGGQAAAGQAGRAAPVSNQAPAPTRPPVPAPQPPVVWPPGTGVAAQTTPQTTGNVSQVTGPQAETGATGSNTSFIQFTLALTPGAALDP